MVGVLFCPNKSVAIDATTASGSTQIGGGKNVRIQNTGTVPVYIKFGGADVAATITDMPIMDNTTPELIRRPQGATHVAAITAAGTATIIFTSGEGE